MQAFLAPQIIDGHAGSLEGVLDATATPRTLRLAGALQGRVAILIGPRGARLEGVAEQIDVVPTVSRYRVSDSRTAVRSLSMPPRSFSIWV